MDLQVYIEDRAVPEPNSGCWLWELHHASNGYGQATIDGATIGAHRLSYVAFVGVIPDGMVVCHKCDVRCCVNPEHLFLGTHSDNIRDRDMKGRQARGERHGSVTRPERIVRGDAHPRRIDPTRWNGLLGDQHWSHRNPDKIKRGEDHGAAVLSDAEVVEIRRIVAAGEMTKAACARKFSISRNHVGRLVHRKSRADAEEKLNG